MNSGFANKKNTESNMRAPKKDSAKIKPSKDTK